MDFDCRVDKTTLFLQFTMIGFSKKKKKKSLSLMGNIRNFDVFQRRAIIDNCHDNVASLAARINAYD